MRRREFLAAVVAAPVAAVAALEPDEDALCGWCMVPLPCPDGLRALGWHSGPEPDCLYLEPRVTSAANGILLLREQAQRALLRDIRKIGIPPGLL